MSSTLEQEVLPSSAPAPCPPTTGTTHLPTRRRGAAAFVEERFLVPTYSSPSPSRWVATHRALSIPLQLQGAVRNYVARREGRELRITGIGRPKRLEPHLRQLLGELRDLGTTSTRLVWDPGALDCPDADIVIAEVHRWVAPRFRNAGWLLMPDSVRWVGDTETLPPPAPCRSLRDDLRKLRRYQYTLEQADDWSCWEQFYDTMLVPQALSRFGNAAWLPSRRFLREIAARGVLHFVRLDGRRLAGICTVRHGDTIWLPVSGVLNGDPVLLRQGVSAAAYAQIFAWARGQGARRIDAGRTGPFVNDGIPRTKAKWGLRPVADPLSYLLALRIKPSEPLRRAFASQPVMVESLDGLKVYPGE